MGRGLEAWSIALAGFGVNWLVQSWVLLAVGLVAGRVVRRLGPAVQSGVYRTTLVAVLVCPLASAALTGAGFDGFSLRLPSLPSQTSIEVKPPASQPPVAPGTPFQVAEIRALPTPAPKEPLSPEALKFSVARRAPVVAPAAKPVMTLARASALCLVIWGLGSAVMGLRLGAGQMRMRRLRASAAPAEADAKRLCREIARRMDLDAPSVWRSPFLFSPCLDGLRRPAILLPDDVGEDLRDTFVHELAHLARRDGLWNLLRRVAAAVLWVQPLLWVLSRRIEMTAEEVCDDYVVHFGADRARYVGHLLDLAGRALPPVAPSGVGMVSLRSMLARRIVRILDTSRTLSTRVGRRATAAMLAAGLAGTVMAGLLGVGGAEHRAKAQTAPAAAPAKGARTQDETTKKAGSDQVTGKSDAATGVRPGETPAAPADVPITGRIVDLEGRPVAGVSVKAGSLRVPKGNDLSPWLDGVKKGEAPWIAAQRVEWKDGPPKTATREATTDQDGRFRLKGFGPDRVVDLQLRGETIAYTNIDVVTRKMTPFAARGFQNTYGSGTQTIFGADFTYTATPSRPVEGVVKDAKTGRPLAGAEVRSYRFAGSDFVGITSLTTKTDAQGRFRLTGLPKGKGGKLLIVPNDEQPYLMQEAELADAPGAGPIKVDVALPRGVWIEGKVTEEATAKPVPGAWLHYMPFLENTFAQAHPVFDKHGNADGVGFQQRYKTKDDGSFRLVGLPGRAIVGVIVYGKVYLQGVGSEAIKGMNNAGHFETYRNPINPGKLWPTVMKEIDPPADAEVVHVDFQVTTGPSVRLKVVDADGKPVAGTKTHGRNGRSSYDRDAMASAEGEATNLMPGEERIVMVRDEARKLGKVVRVRQGDDTKGPVLITLEPLARITGRVADADGNPVAGATVRPDLLPSGDFSLHLTQVATDKDGRFHIADVPTGCNYSLLVENNEAIAKRQVAFTGKDIVVKPGETTTVDEIRFKND